MMLSVLVTNLATSIIFLPFPGIAVLVSISVIALFIFVLMIFGIRLFVYRRKQAKRDR